MKFRWIILLYICFICFPFCVCRVSSTLILSLCFSFCECIYGARISFVCLCVFVLSCRCFLFSLCPIDFASRHHLTWSIHTSSHAFIFHFSRCLRQRYLANGQQGLFASLPFGLCQFDMAKIALDSKTYDIHVHVIDSSNT